MMFCHTALVFTGDDSHWNRWTLCVTGISGFGLHFFINEAEQFLLLTRQVIFLSYFEFFFTIWTLKSQMRFVLPYAINVFSELFPLPYSFLVGYNFIHLCPYLWCLYLKSHYYLEVSLLYFLNYKI